jgi:uncharacterized protein YkwD
MVNRRAVVTAVAAFVAILAPATESHASGFSYVFATPPQVTTPGEFGSEITALTSVDGPLTIDVTAADGTTITGTADPTCTLTATGEECVTKVTAGTVTNLPFQGTYTGFVVDLHIAATDADGPVTFAGNTWFYAPPANIIDPPTPPVVIPPSIPPSLVPASATTEATDRKLAGTALLRHRRTRVIELTNSQRTATGEHALTTNTDLTRSAQHYVDHLATDGAFSHTDGSVLTARVAATGYRYQFIGENLALGQTSPASVVAAWMASPDHRANMLDPRFTQMGVGIVRRPDGELLWCIDFGWPAP